MERIIPIIEVLRLLVADPELFQRFKQDPAGVFLDFGIDRPEYFLGPRAVQCPVMPPIPPKGEASRSIAHPYWHPWLVGGALQVQKLGVSDVLLKSFPPLPPRASLSTEDWEALVARVRQDILHAIAEIRANVAQ
jgi:hypothetical protein